MKKTQKTSAIILVLLLAATVYGLFRTAEVPKLAPSGGKNPRGAVKAFLVDHTPLKSAQRLARVVTSDEEIPLAKNALKLADYEVDLAYEAVRSDFKRHPPALSAQAQEIKDRLEKIQKLVADDEAQIATLKESISKTTQPAKKETLQDRLDDLEADRDLAEDEVNTAEENCEREGCDPEARLDAEKQQHEEEQKQTPTLPDHLPVPADQFGLIHRYQQWTALHNMHLQLWDAKQDADNAVTALTGKHNALETRVELEKEKSADLAHHAKKKGAASAANSAGSGGAPQADNRTAEELAAAADRTWALAGEQEELSSFNKRIQANKDLSAVYTDWIDSIAVRQRAVLHRALNGILIILAIALVSLYFMTLADHILGRLPMDRRQVQNLRGVASVSLRIAALLLILLVIMGPPGQLGTFLGLAGAGLTVALKDFIVGFIGWFVLMGKNGIRLGDWVEINGVTGEVVELGMFHTVLLETGNWTDTGHPTGRRVTFTNSFAIEGHYFNFSTSGQWLWDELQVVLPVGQDPYPVVAAIQKEVASATAESAKQAEAEWQRAAGSRDMKALSAAPAINVKPVIGGVEIAVRYVTRAHERYQLRAKLYQAAVDLLGQRAIPPASKQA